MLPNISRKVRISAVTILALLLLYAALGFWLVPRLVKGQIEAFSEQHWQRKPALGVVSFNPFTLSLQLEHFAFQDSRDAPLLAFDRLLVDLDISSIWRRGVSLHVIELDRPSTRILVRTDGSLNLGELAAPFAAPADTAPADEEPARVFIDRFQLRDGVFEFEDHARSSPFKARLTPVDFELLDFSTVSRDTGATGNRYELQAMSTSGEKFRWSGNFGLSPLSSRGQFELAEVRARTLWSYLQESLGFEVADGVVAINGGYEFAATEPDIDFAVHLAQVNVAALKLRPRGGEEDWVTLDSLAIADSKIDLARRVVDIASVRLENGSVVAVRRANGSLNLLELLTPPATTGADAAQTTGAGVQEANQKSGQTWTVNVPGVSVNGLSITARDEFVTPAAMFTLAPVNLAVRGFSTAPGNTLDLEAELTLQSGGRLSMQGKATPSKNVYLAKVSLADLDLTAFQPYVGTYTQMTLRSGVLDTELDAEIRPESQSITGSLSSTRLHTVDNALREDLAKWDRLSLDGLAFRRVTGTGASNLRIASITAKSPYLRFIIAPDQTTNIGKVLARPASAPGPVQTVRGVTDPAGTSQAMAVEIGKVRVENGSANFADFWITPNYAVSLQQLGGTITGLSSRKDSRAKLALNGKIDRYAPVEIAGELNLLSASLFTDLRVKFEGVELTSVTPYSGRFAGYRIEKGKLSVDVRYKVDNRKLEAEQRFLVDQLTLGERVDSPDAVKLPLRLAVALLKDRNGVIDLGLPITGSLDDPKFRLGPIVWKAFVNLLAGVATSPFKLLGGMFGGGEEVNLIDFEPGEATLDAAGTGKLASLTKALRERPQLALEVPAIYAPDADFAMLASRAVEARLRALSAARKQASDALLDPARRFELLVALHQADKSGVELPAGARELQQVRARDRDAAAVASANEALEAALRPDVGSLDAELQALAQQRSRVIQDALLSSGEVEPGRVFMLATAALPAAHGKVRAALSLK
jgi:hypothetical protein